MTRALRLVLVSVLPAIHAYSQPPDKVPDELIRKARERGSVRVIVELQTDVGFSPEGQLTGRGAARQRRSIAESRGRLLNRMSRHTTRTHASFETIPFVALEVDADALQALEADDGAVTVVEDLLLRPLLASSNPVIGADLAWAQGYEGAGQAVAILDTGVEFGHAFLGGRVVSEACYSTTSAGISATSLCPNDQSSMTGPGAASPAGCAGVGGCDHGTHVAGIAAGAGATLSGVARGANVIAVQVFSLFADYCGGSPCVLSYSSDQLRGLERVYALRSTFDIASVNLSLGGGFYTTTCDGVYPAYTSMVDTLISVGIATVIAAGNEYHTDGTGFPGCISGAITVGATTDSDVVVSFSNSAAWVDLLAPGTSITSSVTGGGFGIKSGTSMATPLVAGAWAVLKGASPQASVTDIRDALMSSGVVLTDAKSGIATPRIQVDAALDLLAIAPPPDITTSALPMAVVGTAYVRPIEVAGGTLPLTFDVISGSLPSALTLDAPTGDVSGLPLSAGSLVFTVRVTDGIGRTDQQSVTLDVALAVPVAAAPTGAIADGTPSFQWNAVFGATGYDLVVDNVTDGGTQIAQQNIAGTSFTPSASLPSVKTYQWRVRARQGIHVGAYSSNLLFEVDTVAPAQVVDLAIEPPVVYVEHDVDAIDSSGELVDFLGMASVADSDSVTFWSSPARTELQSEFLVVDLGAVRTMGRVRLRSRNVTALTFPVDFDVEASNDGVTFTTVAAVRDLVPIEDTFHDVAFTPVSARYVRIEMSRVQPYIDGTYYTQVAEVVVEEPVTVPNALVVRWTATGDDGASGRAMSYALRWSSSPIDGANFQAATAVAGVPAPSNAGQSEEVLLNGLPDETLLYFALRATDDVGNVSGLSNVAQGATAGEPPAAVTDLTAATAGLDSIDLSWTSPGDDGNVGTASSYEIRYSMNPIAGGNFGSATAVPSPVTPLAAGTPQAMTVSGLASATTYYFAMKAADGTGNVSALSNVAVASTGDAVPPAPVSDLVAGVGGVSSYTPLVVTALGSSGDLAASVSKEKATDGNVVTFWSSVGRLIPQEEYLTVDTGSVRMLGRVHLTSRNVANLFPEDFDIQISTDDVSYVTVASETGFVSTPGTPYTFVFSPATARYVKLRVTKARQYVDGTYYVQVAEMSVDEVTSQADQVTLGWTSPGDDGTVGTASSYELRYSTSPINAGNFPSAMLVAGVSAPQVAGSAETHVLTGLSAETLYYFALKTKDEAPNESGLSNVSQVQTVPVPPAAVSDLAASGATTSSVDLDWTATGDDGLVGQATSYEVRYSTSPLTDENFGSATLVVSGVPSPSPSGQAESMTVGSLSASMPYYFGLKVHDDASGVSLLSNVVMKETLDNIVPSTVTDLSGGMGGSLVKPVLVATASSGDLAASVSKEKAVDGSATTFWSSVGTSTPQVEFLTVDTGSVRDLRQVDLIARNVANLFPEDFEVQVSENGVDYTTVVSETGHVAAPGSRSSFVFSSVFGRYVRLRVTKARQYVDGGYYVQFAELEVYEFQSQSGSVLLSWTAPGDDGSVGQATSYDVRYSQSLITAGNFGSAPEAVGEPSPSVAGSAESFLVTGLSAETGYYFALKTTDDSTNTSGISNVVLSYTPGTPPSSVTDLVASNPTNTTVDLDWTSTGDDGLVGTASSYELRYSTSPVTAGNFSGAMLVGSPPVPSVSGSPETKTVGGLTPGETYYFALKVVDEAGNKSGLSNVVTGTTVDDIAPSTVTDLGLSLGSVILQNVPSVGVGASGELLPVTNVTDGSLITIWSSLGSAVQREEFVTVDMGGMHLLGRVRLRSRTVAPELFPEDVVVEVSADNVSFTPVHTATGLGIQASTWFTLDMGTPTLGRYVRIRVTKMRPYAPDNRFYAQIAEVETLESVTSVNVSWTAPGDDGSVGTASSYDLRYSTSPITAGNFAAATPVAGVPAPSVAGSAEAHTVGVLGGSTHYFALKSTDDQGNVSNLSNVTSLTP